MKMKKFAVGDQLMVPFFGVSEVVASEQEEMLGQELWFYHLRPMGMKVELKIPASELERRGVRPLASPSRMAELLDSEMTELELECEYPHQRVAVWKDLLRSGEEGCRRQMLAAMENLEKDGARLTSVEKELRERARLSFRNELEVVLGVPASQAGRMVNQAISA